MAPVQYTEKTRLHKDQAYHHRPFFIKNVTIITRTWGILTLMVMWAAAIVSVRNNTEMTYVGWYLVAGSILVTFFEVLWMLDKCVCCVRSGCCCMCWSAMLWVDTWKKGILYLMVSIPMFLNGMRIYLGMISGFMLMFLAFLYIIKTFKHGIVYEIQETKVINTETVRVITHEASTQTIDDSYLK